MNRRAIVACFHCGLPAASDSPWQISIDGSVHSLCCPGCEAVARGILQHGLADFYRQRQDYSAPVETAVLVSCESTAGDSALLSVEAIRCGACAWLIESRLRALDGVIDAELNLSNGLLRVGWRAGACTQETVRAALAAIGYPSYPYDPQRHGARLDAERKTMFKRLFVAGLSMMQVMMYVLPDYLAAPGESGIDPPLRSLLLWAACILTLPALLYAAAPFWRGAWRSVRAGRPGMDVPVALGIACAFGASVVALLRGSGATYFDAVSMFIFLLLASQYLELRARCAAAALLQRLRHALPPAALLLSGYPSRQGTLVPAAALQAGDYVLVPAGESVAADGVLADRSAEVVLALLTGEPMPQRRQAGDPVPSGAVNSGQAMVLRVSRPAGESTLALLAALVERAGVSKPAIALWADRVGAWFVAALLVLAALVLLLWYPHGAARAWEVAVAVLVVSCPCALSLATPAALAAAGSRLLRGGVLVVQPHVLETLRRATHVVFDKTGTLTNGAPALVATASFGDLGASDCLHIAAALASGSTHPLAKALVAANGPTDLAASELQQHTGAGISGTIDGHAWRLGNARFTDYAGAGDSDASYVYLAREEEVMARFSLRDTMRDDAAALVLSLQRRGVEVIILSGDAVAPVRAVAASLGVRDWRAGQLPQDKLDAVLALQAGGAVVAMVGDGINDAAVLRAADVSFAMGKGSDLACLNADCVLLRDSLDSLQLCVDVAHRTMAVIRQNLAWALVYNACAIPAAALGLLQPWMAAAGMSLSSAVVVLNALRLRREH